MRKTFLHGRLIVPEDYESFLSLRQTERAIKTIKDHFQGSLVNELNLYRISAPLFVSADSGINDNLSGVEAPVKFKIKMLDEEVEIIQSLAKWKRNALADYNFKYGEGLYADMNAIRPDEVLDNFHSIYVDQWDWEKIITKGERNLAFLKSIAAKVYGAIRKTENMACDEYKELPSLSLPEEIYFVHSEELEKKYPSLSPKQREDEICREKGAVFIIGIGAKLGNGKPHDERAADYDDWITETSEGRRGLNGDIIVWYPLLDCAVELSSMGIRVDRESLLQQLRMKGELNKTNLYYHERLLNEELPLTIGGRIGQSRLCMVFLKKAHVGEVQSSIWSHDMLKICAQNNIKLL